MLYRRNFLKTSLCAGISLAQIPLPDEIYAQSKTAGSASYKLNRHVPTRMFDGKRCWCHPRAGIVPAAGKDGQPPGCDDDEHA